MTVQLKHIKRVSPYGDQPAAAFYKSRPEDFVVTEIPKHLPQGEGEHLWLWVKKRNTNTDWVADQLAIQAGLARKNISYAGRKDRFAITTQWFSIYDPQQKTADLCFNIEGADILQMPRHSQKLRTGQLLGNNFQLTLRDIEGDREQVNKRLQQIKTQGFPNFFGEQRFGRSGRNLQEVSDWISKGVKKIRRNKRSLYISTLRSLLFNAVLAKRIELKIWNKLLRGDLAQLSGTKSSFLVEDANAEQDRCDSFDIHPTGPLSGKGNRNVAFESFELERSVLSRYQESVNFLNCIASLDRRSLRCVPRDMSWQWRNDKQLNLSFSLPAGSYATVLLEQVFILRQGGDQIR